MKRVLVLYSGGKDSLLSAILLLEQEYQVVLVHYDNSFEIGSNNIKSSYNRLVKKYGSDKVKYLGIKKIDAIFRTLIRDFYNIKVDKILNDYGNISFSQFNCLACRLSMYILSIIICNKLNISYVADGARNSQLFAIEQEEMLCLFSGLFKKYKIRLLLPVKDLVDDFEEKNELLIRGIIPKTIETQCLIGMPLDSDKVDYEVLNASVNVYKDCLFPKIDKLIERYKNIEIGEEYI